MAVLLTLVAWVPVSFLSAWFWGTAFSRGGDRVECEPVADPMAPGQVQTGHRIVAPRRPIHQAVPNVTEIELHCEWRCHPAPRNLLP